MAKTKIALKYFLTTILCLNLIPQFLEGVRKNVALKRLRFCRFFTQGSLGFCADFKLLYNLQKIDFSILISRFYFLKHCQKDGIEKIQKSRKNQ